MQYELQCEETQNKHGFADVKEALVIASSLEELMDKWLEKPERQLRLCPAIDDSGKLNGKVAVELKREDGDCAWIEIPIAELRDTYPNLISVRELMQGCPRSENWRSEADEEASFSGREKALEPLDKLFPSTFDDEFCTELVAREHVIPLGLCYAISGRGEAVIEQKLLYGDEEFAEDSVWTKRVAGDLSIMYQDPERGHGFGQSMIFDCGEQAPENSD